MISGFLAFDISLGVIFVVVAMIYAILRSLGRHKKMQTDAAPCNGSSMADDDSKYGLLKGKVRGYLTSNTPREYRNGEHEGQCNVKEYDRPEVSVAIGYICACISFFFLPYSFGIAGIICGGISIAKKRLTVGAWQIFVSLLCWLAGTLVKYSN
jgi:hypothetical protein